MASVSQFIRVTSMWTSAVPPITVASFPVRVKTLMKTVAEIATPFNDDDPSELDFYVGSTFGGDAIFGYAINERLKPYVSVGFTDASTFFYIGDDAVVSNNANPYASVVASAGAQWSLERFEFAGEFYAAPGVIYTGRVRATIKL